MTMAQEHLRFAAIARNMGDDQKRQRHLLLAEEAQEACDSGRCGCAQRNCKPVAPGFKGWGPSMQEAPFSIPGGAGRAE